MDIHNAIKTLQDWWITIKQFKKIRFLTTNVAKQIKKPDRQKKYDHEFFSWLQLILNLFWHDETDIMLINKQKLMFYNKEFKKKLIDLIVADTKEIKDKEKENYQLMNMKFT
ncbi:hypothetical protein HYE03_00935 [Mycoplasmopsis bovis]|nr:hypothetical protein [Mycoplasmopsis bovis]QQH27984.1 hypothetical protein HYE03_00935 [Mycoplasmopsis bovis]